MRILHIFLALFFGLLTLLSVVALAFLVREAWMVRDAPLSATVAQAVALDKSHQLAWVQLSDASADCSRYAASDKRQDDGSVRTSSAFVAVNAAKDIEIAVMANDVGACGHLGRVHFIGVIKLMDNEQRRKFAADGLPLSESSGPKWWLCTWCVPADDRTSLLILAAVMFMLMVAMAGTTHKLWRGRNPPPPVPPVKSAPKAGRRAGRKEKRAKNALK